MKFRLLGILLLTISCGKQVNIDHTALEEASASKSTYKDGSVSKLQSGSTYIAFNNNSYKLSANSSHDAKNFIAKLPLGQTQVRFLGTASGGEIIISEIQKK